jgi:thiol-disulfide isomerase/thioredoxin
MSIKRPTLILSLAATLSLGVVLVVYLARPLGPENGLRPGAGPAANPFRPLAPREAGKAPNVMFYDAEGRELTLSSYRGRVVLVNVWATWCDPCLLEMPSLDRLQRRLGGLDFTVLPLSQDAGGIPDVVPWYDRLGLVALPMLADRTGHARQAFGVRGVPFSVLIDREGRMVWRHLGPLEWDRPEAVAFIESVIAKDRVGEAPPLSPDEEIHAPSG